MRFTVTQIRVAMLVFNLLLAIGVPAYAVYGYFGRSDSAMSSFKPVDVAKLRPSEGEILSGGPSPTARWQRLGDVFQPKPPSPPAQIALDTGPTAPKPPEPEGDDGVVGPGPLAEQGWTFSSYMERGGDMSNTLVILKKVDPAVAAGGARGAAAPRPRTPPAPLRAGAVARPRQPGAAGVRVQGAGDQISFLLKEREIQNEELGLHFYAHHVDARRFVYWVPGDSRLYALEYKAPGHYADLNPPSNLPSTSRTLGPPPATPEDAAAAEEAKKRPRIQFLSQDWRDQREEDYQRLLAENKISRSVSSPSPSAKKSSPSRAPTPRATLEPPQGPGVPRPAAPPGTPPTQEEIQELRKAIDAIPKEAQAELNEALKDMMR